MDIAKAHIKVQTWEWIPDQIASACQVIVYDPSTILPVYQGWTSIAGYVEFDVDPGMYVVWVIGHNPMGFRPFLSDTWVPVAVLPGETKEVCAALVSLIDIPVLYDAAQNWTQWKPETFATLLHQYSQDVLKICNITAIKQREALFKHVGDLQTGIIEHVEAPIDVRRELLQRRRHWADQVAQVVHGDTPQAVAEAKEAVKKVIEAMQKRMGSEDLARCCAELGGFSLDFSHLPFPLGYLPKLFTFGNVEFISVYGDALFSGDGLVTVGQIEIMPNTWIPATVKLDLAALPCHVCRIEADVYGRGPEARMEAQTLGAGIQTAVCPGDKVTLTLTTSPDHPFTSVKLSGSEAIWYSIRIQ